MIPSMNYMSQLWAQLLADGGIIIPFLLSIVVLIWWGLGSRFYVLFTTEASLLYLESSESSKVYRDGQVLERC